MIQCAKTGKWQMQLIAAAFSRGVMSLTEEASSDKPVNSTFGCCHVLEIGICERVRAVT